MRSSLYRDRRLAGRGEGWEVGRIRQSGGLKAPDKAEEGEGGDDDGEEVLPDVTEFRPSKRSVQSRGRRHLHHPSASSRLTCDSKFSSAYVGGLDVAVVITWHDQCSMLHWGKKVERKVFKLLVLTLFTISPFLFREDLDIFKSALIIHNK